jgi:hypothetical protein
MPVIRSSAERTALVNEAIEIDKLIVSRLQSVGDVPSGFNDIYQGGVSTANEAQSLAAADRISRIVQTLIEEENMVLQTAELTTISTDTTNMSTKITNIDDSIDRIRSLGDRDEDGQGFRTIQPYGELSLAILWKLYIEEGQILDLADGLKDNELDEYLQQQNTNGGNERVANRSRQQLNEYINRIRNGYRDFGE